MSQLHKPKAGWLAGFIFLLLGVPFAPGSGWAQVSEADQDAAIEELIVTARRKQETIFDVPLGVTAFDEADIDRAGFADFNDLFLLAPGVFNSTSGGRSDRVTIRGFSQVSTSGGSNAGIFMDGVFVSGPVSALNLDLVERVEIVKGPQSVQFGRGTLAGAVNYVSRRPGEEFAGKVKLSAATLGDYRLSGYVSGPVSDNLSVSFAASGRSKQSEFFNQDSQTKDMGGKDSTAFSGSALLRPSDYLSFFLRVSYTDIADDPTGMYTQGPEFNNCNLDTTRMYYCGEIEVDYDDIRHITQDGNFVGGEAGTDREVVRLALIADLEVGESGALQSITGWHGEDERWGSDATNRAVRRSPLLPRGSAVDISRDWTDFSQEFRYSHRMGDRVELLAGAFLFRSERDEVATYIPEDRGTFSQDNWALFGSVEFALASNLRLTAELRYQEDDIELDDPDSNLFVESSFNATLPRLTLAWEPTENAMIYAVYAQGNKPGSVNTRLLSVLDPALIPIDEEENEMFELGAKGRLMDGRLSYQLAGYKYDWTNQQLTQQYFNPTLNQTATYTGNIGESEVTGLEADIGLELVEGFWSLRLTAAYNDAEIQSLLVDGSNTRPRVLASDEQEAAAFGYPVTTESSGNLFVTVSGTPAPASPELTFSATSAWSGPLGDTGYRWFSRLDYAWMDEQFASVFGQASSGKRSNLNLRAGVEKDGLRLEAFATNLTDDETPLALVRTVRFDGGFRPPAPSPVQRAFSAILPQGRQFGLTASYEF